MRQSAQPDRVAALILYGSYACSVQIPDYPAGRTPEENERELAVIREHWGDEAFITTCGQGADVDPTSVRWFTRLTRLSASPRDAEALTLLGNQIDIRHLLPTIQTPTLVIHRTGAVACKIGEGHYVAEHIPGARFVELPGDEHIPYLGDHDAIIDEIEALLATIT